jgi:hypothetical protein
VGGWLLGDRCAGPGAVAQRSKAVTSASERKRDRARN